MLVPADPVRHMVDNRGMVDTQEYPNPIDISGGNSALPETMRSNHYASAGFYSNYWNFDPSYSNELSRESSYFDHRPAGMNTLLYRGHYFTSDINGTLNDTHPNTGHWGPNVYPGCGLVRKGLAKCLEPISYAQSYGATSQRMTLS